MVKSFSKKKRIHDMLHASCKGRCGYCGIKLQYPKSGQVEQTANTATIDHVIPKSQGGADTLDNLMVLCRACNLLKADEIPSREVLVDLFVSQMPDEIFASPKIHKYGVKNEWYRSSREGTQKYYHGRQYEALEAENAQLRAQLEEYERLFKEEAEPPAAEGSARTPCMKEDLDIPLCLRNRLEFRPVALEYFKPPFKYENIGQTIYCDSPSGQSMALQVRGWGNLTGLAACKLPKEQAEHVQDEFGQWVCDVLNSAVGAQ